MPGNLISTIFLKNSTYQSSFPQMRHLKLSDSHPFGEFSIDLMQARIYSTSGNESATLLSSHVDIILVVSGPCCKGVLSV
jgi:hypothetical protein